jgi:hypothetical protein
MSLQRIKVYKYINMVNFIKCDKCNNINYYMYFSPIKINNLKYCKCDLTQYKITSENNIMSNSTSLDDSFIFTNFEDIDDSWLIINEN